MTTNLSAVGSGFPAVSAFGFGSGFGFALAAFFSVLPRAWRSARLALRG
jgi:hypothetical protein